MTLARSGDDRGSTIPLYIWLVGVLLFVAFLFFVLAKGAVARNGAQSAADAAALAAAQDVRDELTDGFLDDLESGNWEEWLDGNGFLGDGHDAAVDLAAANDASLTGLATGEVDGKPSFEARVETNYAVGESLVPGTENTRAKAQATAVIEPRCNVEVDIDPAKDVKFTCEGSGSWEIDPKDPGDVDLPKAKDLFAVHLAD
ncbi:pilus assembly protein TadG-related protein [Streptomyces luteolus]|uniref:Pilus assembly protein TadG-related protein n=1 Tax=Streptomyces luteolus TaxID=3043615 RepID=A0ABT6SV92_9ACTN|nr:pilus assembly protein TadG-related protein [Streptomyces sp. B-S-A12]MDI3419537.1 pilus assembly protein TadG-related protein [Streptomyces sp. B-S-A12]